MKKIFILGILLCATNATAEIPTVQYVLEYYANTCGWPGEEDWIKNDLYPASDTANVATQWIALNVIDNYINRNTTYASDLQNNNVMSTGYLQDTLALINNTNCCVGGIRDFNTWGCVDGCPAANPKCCADGTLFDYGTRTCVDSCPANNKQCCPDTWDNYEMRCVTCPSDSKVCCPDTWDLYGRECIYCPAQYVWKNTSCPAGWERVEMKNLDWTGLNTKNEWDEYDAELSCPTGTMLYLRKNYCSEMGVYSTDVRSFDTCIPPLDGDIIAVENEDKAWGDSRSGYFAIGDGCTGFEYNDGVRRDIATCERGVVSGRWECGGAVCNCQLYTVNELPFYSYAVLKQYDTATECVNSCGHDCGRAMQTMTGFRHYLLGADYEMCAM